MAIPETPARDALGASATRTRGLSLLRAMRKRATSRSGRSVVVRCDARASLPALLPIDLPHRLLESIDAAANAMGMVLDLQLNKRAYLVGVATIFVPLTFITGFFGMNFGWMVDRIDTQIAFWLLGFVVPAATAALSWRLLVRRFVMGDER